MNVKMVLVSAHRILEGNEIRLNLLYDWYVSDAMSHVQCGGVPNRGRMVVHGIAGGSSEIYIIIFKKNWSDIWLIEGGSNLHYKWLYSYRLTS